MAKQNFLKLPDWLKSNVFYRAKIRRHSDEEWESSPCTAVHPYDANLISSENAYGSHYLMLDLDDTHWYSESSTKGHGHLVISKMLEIDQLKEIVDILVKHGILQEGIKRQLDDRGCLTLRMPGMQKDRAEDNMSFEELKAIGKEPELPDEVDKTRYNNGGPIFASDGTALKKFFDVFNITA